MSNAPAGLKIVRMLDVSKLSKEALEYFDAFEGSPAPRVVDADRPRDYMWTDEIVSNTIDIGIADANNDILAKGFLTVSEAEEAKGRARISFKLELDPTVEPIAKAASHDAPLSELIGS